MSEPEVSTDTDQAAVDSDDLAACKEQMAELRAELTRSLWQVNHLITVQCALSHLASPGCDCDERIDANNNRMQEIAVAGRHLSVNV